MQLVFEIYCVFVAKLKTSDKDSVWITLRNIGMQLAMAGIVCIVICFDGYCLIIVHSVQLRAIIFFSMEDRGHYG